MDRPELLGEPDALRERLAQVDRPHVAPLTEFVRRLRIRVGSQAAIPYFDPWDGGVNAKVLFLLEAPGPKARNSGFVSMNNPDQTARNLFELSREASLDRRDMVTWNAVPSELRKDRLHARRRFLSLVHRAARRSDRWAEPPGAARPRRTAPWQDQRACHGRRAPVRLCVCRCRPADAGVPGIFLAQAPDPSASRAAAAVFLRWHPGTPAPALLELWQVSGAT